MDACTQHATGETPVKTKFTVYSLTGCRSISILKMDTSVWQICGTVASFLDRWHRTRCIALVNHCFLAQESDDERICEHYGPQRV